jgi:hypothetical protein
MILKIFEKKFLKKENSKFKRKKLLWSQLNGWVNFSNKKLMI